MVPLKLLFPQTNNSLMVGDYSLFDPVCYNWEIFFLYTNLFHNHSGRAGLKMLRGSAVRTVQRSLLL